MIEESFVCPYLIGLNPADVTEPLSQFQATIADKEDTKKLLGTINRALQDSALKDSALDKTFEKWWPEFEKLLKSVPLIKAEPEPIRKDRELLEEILSSVRELNRNINPTAYYIPAGQIIDKEGNVTAISSDVEVPIFIRVAKKYVSPPGSPFVVKDDPQQKKS